MTLRIFLFVFLALSPVAAQAAENNAPLEISADQALEWRRGTKEYVARGNVLARQGADDVRADELVAHYTENAGGSPTIHQLVATGHVIMTTENGTAASKTIASDVLTVWLDPTSNGKGAMTRAEATGNVIITTPKEHAIGSKAIYTKADDTAILDGPVTITRGQDVLNGTRAVVNLKTGLSTLYGGGNSGSRVTGVFYTGTAKKTAD